jgi:hypothetical protein
LSWACGDKLSEIHLHKLRAGALPLQALEVHDALVQLFGSITQGAMLASHPFAHVELHQQKRNYLIQPP